MNNPYIIQSIGLTITAIGILALVALTNLYGRPLSDEERLRMGEKSRSLYRLPINIETIIAALILLVGIGILGWSKFDLCTFVSYWMPNLPNAFMATLKCR
ncbi:MAG TPA: hypothetical protein VJ987_10985 [Anaerolineales bacterium]|nr:hypothetical protein [Anaerolineales bacterium]